MQHCYYIARSFVKVRVDNESIVAIMVYLGEGKNNIVASSSSLIIVLF